MYTIALLYLIINGFVFGYAAIDLKDFYPFGELNGDTVLPRGENQCGSVIMQFPSQDGSNMIDTEFYISTNGVISINKTQCSFSKGIPPISQLEGSYWSIAPFLTLTSTAIFGTVQFRVTYDTEVLERVNNDISDTGLLSYNATNALITTWLDMTFAAYSGDIDSTPKNSFQAVLTSDGYYTYAIFYYNKITWNQGDYTAPCTGDTKTGIGYNCKTVCGSRSFFGVSGFDSKSLLMTNSSNVNRPGVWIVRNHNTRPHPSVKSIKPAYQDMMKHRSLKVIIPASLNCSSEWIFKNEFLDFKSNCHIASTSHDETELSCLDTFAPTYGPSRPFLFVCDGQIENFDFIFKATVFLTPPVPEANINVLNVSVVDYSVSIELRWNAPLIAELNPGCETVNITMHVLEPYLNWNEPIMILQSVNNSGGLDIKLVEPNTGLFLSKHLLFGVTGNDGPYVTNQNTIFSKMFVFDLENFNLKRKVRSLRDFNVLATVDMMGHRKLNISYSTTPGQDGLGCKFNIGKGIMPVTPAIASSDNNYITCYVPFSYIYSNTDVLLVAGSPSTNTDMNDFQFQRMGDIKKHSNIYKTETKFNDYLLKFYIDVLPSFPRLAVEQVGTRSESNGQFQVQMQFTWDPSEIPSEYPVLNAFIYQYDDDQYQWMKELMVSPQYIPPNAGSVSVALSQEAITVFFNYKVMFGLGYVQGDENFVIFSKMYIPGVST